MLKSNLKILTAFLILGILGGSFYYFAYNQVAPSRLPFRPVNKPVAETNSDVVSQDTRVIYEKEYTRSNAVVISGLENAERLIGKKLEDIEKEYSAEQGFTVSFSEGNLIIHQKIDDWTPEDKSKYRIKEYKSYLAVFQGPDPEHDILIRVTPLLFSRMPQSIQEAIRRGEYEFNSEAELNDALENLDEYM